MLDLKKYCVTLTNGNVESDIGIETYAFNEEDLIWKLRSVINDRTVQFIDIYELEDNE